MLLLLRVFALPKNRGAVTQLRCWEPTEIEKQDTRYKSARLLTQSKQAQSRVLCTAVFCVMDAGGRAMGSNRKSCCSNTERAARFFQREQEKANFHNRNWTGLPIARILLLFLHLLKQQYQTSYLGAPCLWQWCGTCSNHPNVCANRICKLQKWPGWRGHVAVNMGE